MSANGSTSRARGPSRTARIVSVLLGAVLLSTVAGPASAITKQEVLELTELGVPPKEIIKAIKKDETVFELSASEVLELKKNDVDQKVIQFMLETPDRFGGGGDGGDQAEGDQAEGDQAEGDQAEGDQDGEDQGGAAGEGQPDRQERKKRLQEKRRAEKARREAYAEGMLSKGMRQAKAGRFVESIETFRQFQQEGSVSPDSKEAYRAKYGIARALVEAELYQAAARQLVDVLLEGPDREFFQLAFRQLRELRREVNYAPPRLEKLTEFFVGDFSQPFQNEYNYVLGQYYYGIGNWSKALQYLEEVSPDAKDYARAQYLKALVEVRNQLFKSASKSFQNAVVATDENDTKQRVKDLAYLGLARIAYKNKAPEPAIYYYRKVPEDSTKRATALYESAWTYFRLQADYRRALGLLHSLHSPYFEDRFYPELWIMEATVYLNLCRFEDAQEALSRYRDEIAPLEEPLQQFLLNTTRPSDYYRALVQTVAGADKWKLPEKVTSAVLNDTEFYNLYQTIQQISDELGVLGEHEEALGSFGSKLREDLRSRRRNQIRAIGVRIQRVLKNVQSSIAGYSRNAEELQVEIQNKKLQQQQRRLQQLGSGQEGQKEADEAEESGSRAIIGSGKWQWPFEGEYWRDEIGSYRARVSNQCPQGRR